jgi:hypothetical protein
MHGVTSSTVAFTSARVDADNEEDSDSGHNSDELNVTSPFIDSLRNKAFPGIQRIELMTNTADITEAYQGYGL